jgi:hypothetical protein
MALPGTMTVDELSRNRTASVAPLDALSGSVNAVSWGAVLAGATAAAALSLILLILGTGLGLSAISPWKSDGASAATMGATGILWITLTQVIAAAAGGYLAGRLRARWLGSHPDEVYFRDTAHGFLAWAVASLLSAALLTSVIGSIISGGVQVGSAAAGGIAASDTVSKAVGATSAATSSDYWIDSLFRREPSGQLAANVQPAEGASASGSGNAEVTRIFSNALRGGSLPAEDLKHVGQLVAMRTGLPQADAEKRVTDRYTRLQSNLKTAETEARAVADKARKASAYVALWIFISLLMGAFASSLAATYGGRRRDL